MENIIIKRFQLLDVIAGDKMLFNTTNHWEDGKPENHKHVIDSFNTKYWIDRFHKKYYMITLERSDLRWMCEALKIGTLTNAMPSLYKEEFEETCNKYRHKVNEINKNLKGKGWFIRTDRVSLKAGKYGIGPYFTIEQIIESLVTTRWFHSGFGAENQECNVYFMEWRNDIDNSKEFRIFVYKNHITAISDQHLYHVNNWLNSLSDYDIKELIDQILVFFKNNIRKEMEWWKSYVMDLAIVNSSSIKYQFYFIEPNSFGAKYSSGSALFHWLNDHTILHDHNTIEFRYVSKD